MSDPIETNYFDKMAAAKLDLAIERDDLGRDVWFPWGSLGRGYIVDRSILLFAFRVIYFPSAVLMTGIVAILVVISEVNNLPINLTNGVLFASILLLFMLFGHVHRLAIVTKLNLPPSQLRRRWTSDISALYGICPTGLLWTILVSSAWFACAGLFNWPDLFGSVPKWLDLGVRIYFGLQIPIVGYTLFRRLRGR
jgi:hypothetical protein